MRKKKTVLNIVCAILIVAFLALCVYGALIWFVFHVSERVSYDINAWNTIEKTHTYLPSVDEMGEYTDLEFKHLHRDYCLFASDAYTCRITYSENRFDEVKKQILSHYAFQQTVTEHGEKTIERNTSFEMDGFDFQMLSEKEYKLHYPKHIVFIGISDDNNEIAFVVFEDWDLDYISDSFTDFLIEKCGWE